MPGPHSVADPQLSMTLAAADAMSPRCDLAIHATSEKGESRIPGTTPQRPKQRGQASLTLKEA
jgi:hypothetical protein